MDPLSVLLRWAHILAAITALGGLLFSRFALLPTAEELGEETADRIHAGVRRRWLLWVIGAITLLFASGLTNYILMIRRVKDAPELWGPDWMSETGYHTLFGIKFLLAMIVFYLASGLVGRGAGTQWIRNARRQWLSVAVGLGVAIVLISGWMRQLHTGANDMPDPVKQYAREYFEDVEAANAGGGSDPDEEGGPRGGRPGAGRAAPAGDAGAASPAPEPSQETPDGPEAEEADRGPAAEDRQAPAAAGGGEAAAG